MRRRIVILLILIAIPLTVLAVQVLSASAEVSSWMSSQDPILDKTNDLPANQMPPLMNNDCLDVTVRRVGSSTMQNSCMVQTALGQVGSDGVIFNGSSEMIPIVPPSLFNGLTPIPNQSMLITTNSAQTIGSYIHFYTSIRDKMKPLPDPVNGRLQYTLTKNPDRTLRDSAGKALPANVYALAFSPNGSWMVVDLPFRGFVRVNLATLEMLPFAPSMNQGMDYASREAQLAITNDGRQVAIKPVSQPGFTVYDLSTCTGAALPVNPLQPKCQSRDYAAYLNTNIPNFRAASQMRFINNVQLSFYAMYDYASANYKVARYTLTAPGESPTGIEYLGMGDSFASGQGAYSYRGGTDTANNACHLSSKSYPFLLTSQKFASGQSVACSGAKTRDIIFSSGKYEGQVKDKIIKDKRENVEEIVRDYTPGYLAQSEFIDIYRPQNLTLSIGGNDIGFADILKSCASPFAENRTCFPTYEERAGLAKSINSLFDKLVTTYQTVTKPGSRLYVIGYPQIVVQKGDCAANVLLDAQEIKLAIGIIDSLNAVIEQAALKAGAKYVDVSQAFAGSRLCETKSSNVAINGFTLGNDGGIGNFKFAGAESYHPNALGHELLSRAILNATDNMSLYTPAATSPGSDSSSSSGLVDASLPSSGRGTPALIYDESLAADSASKGDEINIKISDNVAALKATSSYTVELQSTPLALGTATTDSLGNLTATIRVPADTSPGFRSLRVNGSNIAGEPISIFKSIYVAASENDMDGDGIPDSQDPCILVAPSGLDYDKDGIDDACDAYIGEPKPTGLTSTARLTSNTMAASRTLGVSTSESRDVQTTLIADKDIYKPAESLLLIFLGYFVAFGLVTATFYQRK